MTATRVFTTRKRREPKPRRRSRSVKRRYPYEALVFDTETTTDGSQRLLFGVWRFYRDDPDGIAGVTCIEEGIFYPDDLPDIDPAGYQELVRYAASAETDAAPGFSDNEFGRRVLLWPLSRWLEKRLHAYGYEHRNRCDIVGFNLFFDLTRIATHFGKAQGQYLGGFSLGIWGMYRGRRWQDLRYHPRLLAKPLDPRRTLFAWGGLAAKDQDRKAADGRFVDLRTLAFALTDRSHALESACAAFGDPFEKPDVTYGAITPELIAYGREDVDHTALLYRNCLQELAAHPQVDLTPHRLYSPATVGTRYLEAMGVAQPLRQFADLDQRIHGWAMAGFYGGRVEARIVRTPVPVAYVDMTSMYPTVNALLDTWPLLTAETITVDDTTTRIRRLLNRQDLVDVCLTPETWSDEVGVTLVEVDHPDGAILPVRGEYDEASPDPRIGLNPLRYQGTLWYTLPDVIASTILTGNPPPVKRAIRLQPHGRQDLQPVPLRGGRTIDPLAEDPFVAFIEERHRVKNDPDLTKSEKERLELFLKITANATSYGVLARFDRRTRSTRATVTVYGPDDEPFEAKTKHPEDPGPYCFPPIAASITAGARLILALLEYHVTQAGGTYAFCDTDSMAIVSHPTIGHIDAPTPDGTGRIPVLTPAQVEEIIGRFDTLNPYDAALIPRLWKAEHDSLTDPLWTYVISSKRYALYRTDLSGGPDLVATDLDADDPDRSEDEGLVDWSEHGLGAYLDPTGPEPVRDERRRRIWIRQVWQHTLNPDTELPDWVGAYALTRYTITNPQTAGVFNRYNDRRHPRERIRGGCFGLIAHPDPITSTIRPLDGQDTPPIVRPVAPYETDATRWPELPWVDRRTGQPTNLTTLTPRDNLFDLTIQSGAVRVLTLEDVIRRFPHQPEHKSLAPNGDPADRNARGRLQRRPVESAPVLTDLIGKEANLLDERLTGQTTDPDDYRQTHGTRGNRWTQLILPTLQRMGPAEVIARTPRAKSAVYAALARKSQPTGAEARPYRDAAVVWATDQLRAQGDRAPRHWAGVLYQARSQLDP